MIPNDTNDTHKNVNKQTNKQTTTTTTTTTLFGNLTVTSLTSSQSEG